MGRLHLLAATTLALLALGGANSAAMAAPRSHVSWRLPASTAGSPTPFSWSSAHLLPGSVVVVQRPVGTARVWRTVVRLSGVSGTASLPALALGSYRLRLAVIAGRQVLAHQQRVLHVFGPVPLGTLFPSFNHSLHGVYSTPTSAFPFIDRTGETSGVLSANHNPCRSVHLEFVPGNEASGLVNYFEGEQATMTLVQETRDPVSVTTPFNVVAGLTATVIPGQSWSVNFSQTGNQGLFEYFINGSAVCDSAAALSQ
jgi:hypothetical protein